MERKTVIQPAVILGIDAASSSGWAIYVRHESSWLYHSSGIVKGAQAALMRQAVVDQAVELGRPVIAVIEALPLFGRAKVLAGLARTRGAWLQALGLRSIVGKAILEPSPSQWRKRVLRIPAWCPRPQAKAAALEWAREHCSREIVSDDEAESACLARYGTLLYPG